MGTEESERATYSHGLTMRFIPLQGLDERTKVVGVMIYLGGEIRAGPEWTLFAHTTGSCWDQPKDEKPAPHQQAR